MNRTTRPIIALVGPKGSGKGLVARRLVEAYGFTDVGMKLAAERMLHAGLGIDPLVFKTDARRAPMEALGGVTPNDLLNGLFYTWGRREVGTRFWASAWRRIVQGMPSSKVVLRDAAYPADIDAVRAEGGVILRIKRQGCEATTTGQKIQEGIVADLTINNDGEDVASLHRLIDVAMAKIERGLHGLESDRRTAG